MGNNSGKTCRLHLYLLAVLGVVATASLSGLLYFSSAGLTQNRALKASAADCDGTYVSPNSLGGFDVTPASDVNKDPVNVQCAIDNADDGGTVNLKAGAFYFADAAVDASAPSGYKINYDANAAPIPDQYGWLPPTVWGANHGNDQTVFVTHSVKIMGQKDSGGNHLTKIVGGYTPLSVGRLPGTNYFNFFDDVLAGGPWTSVDTTTQELDVTIKDLEFADPFGVAIVLSPVTGATVEGNKFVDGRGMDLTPILSLLYGFQFYHTPESYSVVVSSPGIAYPHLTRGDINVINNVFEGHDRLGDSDDPWVVSYPELDTSYRGLTIGVRTLSVAANVTVAMNTIKNLSSVGIASEDVLSLNGVGGNLVIADNTLDLGSRSITYADFLPAIWAGDYSQCGAECRAPYEDMGITVGGTNLIAKNNDIKMGSPTIWPGVIYTDSLDGATIKSNEVELSGEAVEWRPVVIMLNTSNSLFGQNSLTGKATAGVWVEDSSTNNVFSGNNLSGLEAPYNYVFYGSSENIVKGYTGGSESVVDGTGDNLLTGVAPVPNSGIGDVISDIKGKIDGLKNNYKSWASATSDYLKAHPEIHIP